MMVRFIDTIVQCQKGCRESGEYERFPDREQLRKLFMIDEENKLLDYDVSRLMPAHIVLSLTSGHRCNAPA